MPAKLHSGPGLRAALLLVFSAFAAATIHAADDPGTLLKRHFESAKSALAAGDVSAAERDYRQTIALGLRQLGNLSVNESRFEEAARELDEALKLAPGDPDVMVDAAIASFRANDVKKARQLAESVVAGNPRNAHAQNVLGRIEFSRGDFPAAIRDLQASVALQEDFETSYILGVAYLQAKRFADGQKWFQRVQETMGESAALHVLIGRAYLIGHFPESAVAEFRRAIQLDPKYPRAHALLGYSILEFRGEEAYPQARLEFERELKLHPEDYNALLLLGISDVALRDFPAAETALLHATRLRPEEPFAYLYLGEIYSETKRLPQAIETLEKYIRLVPNPEEVPRDVSRAYYLLGQDLRRLGRLTFSTSPPSLPTVIATLPTALPACSNREPRNRKNRQKQWRKAACGKIPPFHGRQRFHKPRNPKGRAPTASSLRKFSPALTTIWASSARRLPNSRRLRSTSSRQRLGNPRSRDLTVTGASPLIARSFIPKPSRRSNGGSLPHPMTSSSASCSA